jgi:hypothetical protein
MNKQFRRSQLKAYDSDYALWCAEQGALLRAGELGGLDRENVAEEIESLGRSERGEIESRLNVLLVHLLKWKHQPSERSGSWEGTILEQRNRLHRRLAESPSLKNHPAEVLAEEYASARLKTSGETGLPRSAFADRCPFTLDQVLDRNFLP